MAITFPVNPAGQTPVNTFSPTSTPVANSANSLTYTWDGVSWTSSQAGNYVNATGDTMTGPLVVPTVTAQDITTGGNTVVGYQQGLWSPTLNSRGSSSSTPYFVVGDATYNDQFNGGWWTRVGNLVSFGGTLRLTNKGSGDGEVWIGGMPYTVPSLVANGPIPYGQGRSTMTLGTIGAGLTNSVNGNIFICGMTSNSATISGETDAQLNIRLTSWRIGLYDVDSHVVTNLERTQISNSFYVSSFSGSYITEDTTWTPINGATVS